MKAELLFDAGAFALFIDERPVSYCRPLPLDEEYEPEEQEQRAWYSLGCGIREAISESVEFLTVTSYTKVVDQLQGVAIEDPIAVRMSQEIITKGLTKFIHVIYSKVSPEESERRLADAANDLEG